MTTATLDGRAPARRLSAVAGLRNSFTLTWRSVLKIRTNSEDLIGLSLQPIMFLLLFTYVFGGAIAHGSTHKYLQYVLPGILVQTVLFATLGTGLMLNQDISAGIFDRFRSLPIARWAPLAGAILGDVTRYVISVVVTLGFAMVLGFRITANPLAAVAGLPAGARFRDGDVLGLSLDRHAGEEPAGRPDVRVHGDVPDRVC